LRRPLYIAPDGTVSNWVPLFFVSFYVFVGNNRFVHFTHECIIVRRKKVHQWSTPVYCVSTRREHIDGAYLIDNAH
jgi:hypothetical protein